MRNLKRALSLALASVMLLGMMVVGSSAVSYPDVSSEDNTEAIAVLEAVKVMIGNEKGEFEPDKNVTRNEMAVIMAKLILGTYEADSYVGSHPFTDVPDWAQRYVAACYNAGIIAGRGEGIYDGNSTVTAVEAAAMMLRALGYEDLSLGAKQWDQPVAAKANEINLFVGLNGAGNAAMNRDSVAQLALNTLQATMVTTTKGTDITLPDGTTFYSARSYNLRSGNYGWKDAINDEGVPGGTYGYLQLGEYLYEGDLKLNDKGDDDFGRPAVEWTYKSKSVISTAKDAELTYTKDVKLSDIYKDLGKPSFVTSGDNRNTVTYKENNVVVNDSKGAEVKVSTFNSSNDGKVGAKGALTSVYKDNDGNVKIVTVQTYLVKANADYSEKNEELSVTPYGVSLSSSKIKDEDVAVSSFKKDDLILVTGVKEGGNLVVKTAELAEKAEDVKVSAYKGTKDSVTAGGTKYEYNANTAYNPDSAIDAYNLQKTSYDLILDNYGYVIGVEKHSDEVTLDDILFVKEADKNGFNWLAKVIFMDGSEKTVTIAGTQAHNGSSYDEVTGWNKTTDNNTEELTTDGLIAEKRFFEFNEKSNGEYELKDIADTRQAKADATGDDAKKNIVGGEVQPIRSTAGETLVAKTANNSTIFIAKDTVYTGVKNSPSVSNADVYYLLDNDSQNYILAAYTAKKGVSTVDVSEYVYVFSGNGRGQDDDDNTYYTYTAIKDGEKLDGSFQAATNSKPTGLYQIETYEDGYPVLGTALTTHDDDVYTYATVGAKTNITYKNGVVTAGKGFMMADDAQVYVVDVADKSVDVIAPSSADKDSLDDGNYAVCAVYESTSSKDVKVLWLIKGSNGRAAVYTSGTIAADDITSTTSKSIELAGVTIDVATNDNVTKVATALGAADSIKDTWDAAVANTDDITLTAKHAGKVKADATGGVPTAAPDGFNETTPGDDAKKATVSGAITIAASPTTGTGDTSKDDKYEASFGGNSVWVDTATDFAAAWSALNITASGYTATTIPSTTGAFVLTADEAGVKTDTNPLAGGSFTNGKAAVAAVYTKAGVGGASGMIATASTTTTEKLTVGGYEATVTGADLSAKLDSFVTSYNTSAPGNSTWTASKGDDNASIIFTANADGVQASGPAGTTLVTQGADAVTP